MNRLKSKLKNSFRRNNRVRATVRGSAERPRLSVRITNKHISAQVIDDDAHKTIVSASTTSSNSGGTMTEKAKMVGVEIAKKAKAKKVNKVAFDRGPMLFHGRVKALADAARQEGLDF